MKAFRAKDGSVRIFRSKDNARRISHSAEVAGMPPIPQDVFLEATYKAVHGNLEFVPFVSHLFRIVSTASAERTLGARHTGPTSPKLQVALSISDLSTLAQGPT